METKSDNRAPLHGNDRRPGQQSTNLELQNFNPKLGIAPMTSYVTPNEKIWYLLQTFLTPYNASMMGLKYTPETFSGTPLIRVIWVMRDGRLTEYQEMLEEGVEVQVPGAWAITVDEAIDAAERYFVLGQQQTQEWMEQAQDESTLIEDSIDQAFQFSAMAKNKSQFGPAGHTQRNGFPIELRDRKFRESNKSWGNK